MPRLTSGCFGLCSYDDGDRHFLIAGVARDCRKGRRPRGDLDDILAESRQEYLKRDQASEFGTGPRSTKSEPNWLCLSRTRAALYVRVFTELSNNV